MTKFSILVMSVPSRIRSFTPNLLESLNKQINEYENPQEIEVLCLYDNKRRSVGEKRNNMISLAKGDFLTFIDDDDRVSDDYIFSIMEAIRKVPESDCIVYDCICTIDAGPPRYCRYGNELRSNYLIDQNESISHWEGKPAHTMTWRTDLVRGISFPHIKEGEDFAWVCKAWPLINIQTRLNKVLYYYDFNHQTTETRR